ncbi:MAG: hypothetical protein GAK43_01700 [Stenotrophomonas maltophilia]|nr:MAG: hypothetical protein GAK43_01700 [Stenotrophomonas maltophilia]
MINAGTELGLFAQSGEMRHIAHQGQLLLQAQHNDIRVQAEQSVEVSASQQHVLVSAKEHITLMCGGAYLTLKDGNIELGMPGTFIVKAAKHSHLAPTSLQAELPQFDVGDTQGKFVLTLPDGQRPVANQKYRATLGSGQIIEGATDENGLTQLLEDQAMHIIRFDLLDME